MTHKAITLKLVVPMVLAIALGISIGAVYLTNKYPVPIDQADANNSVADSRGIAELPNPGARLLRVRLLLSSMK
jgi:hypothetical protein